MNVKSNTENRQIWGQPNVEDLIVVDIILHMWYVYIYIARVNTSVDDKDLRR